MTNKLVYRPSGEIPVMAIADTLYELVKTLSEDKANLMLTFVQFVRQQDQRCGVNGVAEREPVM